MKTMMMLILSGVLLLVAGCDRSSSAPDGGKPRIVATTMMIGDLVRQIAGDNVELRTLFGPTVDPHTYKPSTADFEDLKKADLVLYNGLHLEGKMVELFEERLSDKAVAIVRDMPKDRLLPWAEGETGAYDPHVWFDVSLWSEAARTVAGELARVDPANADLYRQNGEKVLEGMKQLHAYVSERASTVPPEQRVLITSHDAFNYFGKAYGFDVRGLQGISTETEAGSANIQAAVDFIVQRKIPAIFVESSVPRATIERVKNDVAARGLSAEIGGELFSDAMGTAEEHPGYRTDTYEGMIRYNIDTIVNALTKK
jgi:manganese/zinc/iron transport system substrate-binding protein